MGKEADARTSAGGGRLARASIGLLIGLQVLLVLVVIGAVAAGSERMRRTLLDDAQDHAVLQVRNLEDYLTQSFSLLQLHLLALGNEHPAALLNPGSAGEALQALLRKLPYLRSLSIAGPDGRILASTNPGNPGHHLAFKNYLPRVEGRAPPPGVLRFGAPWRGRDFTTGQPLDVASGAIADDAGFFPVTMALPDHPGLHLVAAINSDYFINYIARRDSSDAARYRVHLDNGTLLFSTAADDPPGGSIDDSARLARIIEQQIGTEREQRAGDETMLLAFRVSRTYPWFVHAEVAGDRILTPWFQDTRDLRLAAGLALAVILLVTGYLTWRVRVALVREERQHEASRLAASIIAHTHEGVLICDDTQRIIDVNPAFTQITGYQRDEVLGRTPRLLASGRQGPEFYRAMWVALERDGHWQGEFWNRRKDGGLYAALSDVSVVRDDSGRITHYINLFSDITQLKHHQERLELLAHFDPLTRLPNRSLLSDRLQQGLARAARERTWLAVCFLDLDGFKAINDIHGHEAGDELLVAVARRLEDGIRGGDTAARLGGDEFVLLLGGISSVAECEQAANRILRAIEQPIPVQGHALHVSASLGITLFPQDSADAEQLMRHADHAMYQAKQLGRNRYFLYDAACDQEARDHRRRTEEIARALEREEFCLYYQPKFDLRRRTISGFEALIRWRHPERGLLLPGDFLPTVAGSDLESRIDEWVVSNVFQQAAAWRQAATGAGRISLNITAASLGSEDFMNRLGALLAENPELQADELEFEVVESSALDNLSDAHRALTRLRDLGFRVALDDFGTGYSSLALLRHLPVNTLKIDQSFVRNMLADRDDLAIVESVIRLASAFQCGLVAEGVETVEHGEALLAMGCEVIQGYCISRPLPADQVARWLGGFRPEAISPTLAEAPSSLGDPSVVVAAMQHRLWVNRLEQLLAGAPEPEGDPIELGSEECQFARWWRWAADQPAIGGQAAFRQLRPIHEEVHALGRAMVSALRQGRREEARACLATLYRRQEALLAALEAIRDAPAAE